MPDTLPDEKVLFLSDILPTAWQAVKNAEVKPGSSVAIFGAGPVGLLCASCARLNGAEQIFIIDHNDYRLDFAQQRYGAIPINFDHHDDPAQWIIDNTPGHRGVDSVIDAVGFEAKGSLTETVLSTLKIEGAAEKPCASASPPCAAAASSAYPGFTPVSSTALCLAMPLIKD
ncbi:zinc-binding dehydrogenase [Klebsiella pneumoniae subsp. pneumoniae]|nr:zinc-binding dehydrogenase [Klebsiella pneumoniae subsp. pneumoniae]